MNVPLDFPGSLSGFQLAIVLLKQRQCKQHRPCGGRFPRSKNKAPAVVGGGFKLFETA